jgi:hypothetical protein
VSHSELLPIPPIDTATEPVYSASDLRQRWRALLGPPGFGEKLLWFSFLGPDRRIVKALSQVPIGPLPESDIVKDLMSALRTVLNDMPSESTVALLLTGPGRGAISPADRQWARSLTEVAAQFDVPLQPIFRANNESILQVEPAWRRGTPLPGRRFRAYTLGRPVLCTASATASASGSISSAVRSAMVMRIPGGV